VTLVDDVPVLWQFDEPQSEDQEVRHLELGEIIHMGAAGPKVTDSTGHCNQYRGFVAAISEAREPAISGSEGRRAVALIRAIYRSSQENRIVQL
jgi:UDP-N-acetyl-2-amino-2-deoxyglucuronate dehydrogenase